MTTPPAFMVAAVQDLRSAYGFDAVPVDVVLAQSALETGNWTSRLFLERSNAFGMRMPRQRRTNAIGETPEGFAVYANPADSVADYFSRQRAFGIPNTSDAVEYMRATVASGYAQEGGYFDAWAARLGTVAPAPAADGSLVPLALVGLLTFAVLNA